VHAAKNGKGTSKRLGDNMMSVHPNHSVSRGVSQGPRIVAWNTTLRCNLRCGHCYIDANRATSETELSTTEGEQVIDQIAALGRSILVLSGGEPLLREDIFDLASYATKKGLIATLGTNGTLIDDAVAKRIFDAGIRKVAISIDSSSSEVHDQLRGVQGAWNKAVEGIKACNRNGVGVQFNVTLTQQNQADLEAILTLAKSLNVTDVHLFFLVPTGRAKTMQDLTPQMYEAILRQVLSRRPDGVEVKPTCAPQFMRIAKEMNVDTSRWSRGCIAAINYCRVLPDGTVTPCPYLPVKAGNLRETSFADIWANSEVLKALRDWKNLKGKCRVCKHQGICGGCRARAYGLTSFCGGSSNRLNSGGDFLAEDAGCTYQPQN
jgi:radical SAM protein with 4Fe4S-binding SPASM domain